MPVSPARVRALVALGACAIALPAAVPAAAAAAPASPTAKAAAGAPKAKSRVAVKRAKRACTVVRKRRFRKAGGRVVTRKVRVRIRCNGRAQSAKADRTPPTAAWTAPSAGGTVSGNLAPSGCSVTASDRSGIAYVDFVLDGASHRRDPGAAYTCWYETIDTKTLSPGLHKLEARVVDTRGNLTIVKREFNVAAPQTTTETTTTETTTTAPTPPGATIFAEDFESGSFSKWNDIQTAFSDRISIVNNPVAGGARAGRFEVRHGEPMIYGGARSELAYTSNMASEGQIRTYKWKTRFAEDYPNVSKWQDFLQWKQEGTGSPPIQMGVEGNRVNLAAGEQYNWADLWSAEFERGKWLDFQVRIKWSTDPSVGWIELWYNGQLALPRRSLHGLFAGKKNYLKIGLYRDSSITQNGVVFHDDLRVIDG